VIALCAGLIALLALPCLVEVASIPATIPSLKVEAFDLRDVKLLDGPFKRAMDRNAKYLLVLEPDRFLHYFRTEAIRVNGNPVDQWVIRDGDSPLGFKTRNAGLATDLKLVPFYEQTGHRYVVYWNVAGQ
jgi:hypothetical protein